MITRDARRRYWRRNLFAVFGLLVVWFIATFVVAYFGRALGSVNFFGWPFTYWVGAQGALIVYLVIIIVYARYMNGLDERFGAPDAHERSEPEVQGAADKIAARAGSTVERANGQAES